jgi:hypothetical protein
MGGEKLVSNFNLHSLMPEFDAMESGKLKKIIHVFFLAIFAHTHTHAHGAAMTKTNKNTSLMENK